MTIKYKEITMRGRCFIANRDDPRVYEVDDDDPYAVIVPRTEMYGEVDKKYYDEIDGMTLQQIADALGVSRNRIRQIEEKAMRKLRLAQGKTRALLKEFL